MESQTYEIKCSKCEKIVGQSSIEDHNGFICQTCDDETQLTNALADGKNYDPTNLVDERPEKFQEIIKKALFQNPSALLSLNFHEVIEDAKKEIQTTFGLDELEHSQKVELLQKIGEEGDIIEMSDQELKNKVDNEKKILSEKK